MSGGTGTADASSLHTSYALQSRYEPLIQAAGSVYAQDIERLKARLTLATDTRDIPSACDSPRRSWAFPTSMLIRRLSPTHQMAGESRHPCPPTTWAYDRRPDQIIINKAQRILL